MNRRKALLGAAFPVVSALLPLKAQGSGSRRGSSNQASGRVQVMVVDAKTRKRLSKARIFVVSEMGGQLTEAWSGEDGLATLPDLGPELKPKYLLVECPWYFITGREWLSGQLEYYMPLMPLTPPGFSG